MAGLLSKESFKSTGGFAGTIELAAVEKKAGFKAGEEVEQLHIGVKPISFEAKGQNGTGLMHDWWKVGGTRSPLYKLVEFLEKCGVVLNDESELIGLTFQWERQTIQLGKGKDGTIYKKDDALVPVKLLSSDEIEVIKAEAKARRDNPQNTSAPSATKEAAKPAAVDFSDETLASVAALLYGKQKAGAITAVAKGGFDQSVIQALVSGKLIPLLKEKGLLKEEDGVYAAIG